MSIIIMAGDDLNGKAALFSEGRLFFFSPPEPEEAEMPPSLFDHIQLAFKNWSHIGPMKIIRRFLADETAATAIEYGMIAAGIAIAIISAVKGVGSALSTKFTVISTSLK